MAGSDDLHARLLQPGLMGMPLSTVPGVATLPFPQHVISDDLEKAVQAELDKAAPGTITAAVNVHTQRGVNVVIATRNASGKLSAALWIGKSGWSEPVNAGWAGGVSLRKTWGGT
jgi:hypothetical protein